MDVGGVLGAQHQDYLSAGAYLIVVGNSRPLHGADQRLQYFETSGHCCFHHHVDTPDSRHGDDAIGGAVAQFQVARLPGAAVFVLREAEREPGGRGEGSFIHLPRNQPSHISNHQPKRPADGRIGPIPRTETTGVSVYAQLPGDGPVDNDCGRRSAGGGRYTGHIEVLLEHRLDRRHHHRKVLRTAARHHGVDC